MSYTIALNFEDGVTRFIQCNAGEKVLDAAYRQKVNLPMDCSDGVCGTCKCHCAGGEYSLGEDYLEEALDEEEAREGQVLTCQMIPHSDCVLDVPTAAAACKTGITAFDATVKRVTALSESAIELVVQTTELLHFLPGQYINVQVPGTPHQRAYSFSSQPGGNEGSFLIRNVPGGLMSHWLSHQAAAGMPLSLTGPMGSFYLRGGERPLLMLAGGTGLAPMLAMLRTLARQQSARQITLLYGVNRDEDLVLVDVLNDLAARLPDFNWLPVVADSASSCAQKGYVTEHFTSTMLNEGEVDIYLCGPPPMVNGVASTLQSLGIQPAGFWYEKFIASQSAATQERI